MAKLYGNIASNALMTFDKSFARANGQPLDSTEVYYSLTAAETYAATDGAYIGQKIVVVENGIVTHYSIEDAAGTLKELGSKPVGDEKSITVAENGTVSLKGVGSLVFEREVDVLDENGEPTGEKKTENVQFQPLMTKDGLVWVEPSKTTVEGLATLIEALTSRVDTAEKAIDVLEDKVGAAAKPETTEGAGDGEAATGLFLALDNEIARAEAAEKALGERIDAIDYVDADELAGELSNYVTTESFGTFKTENTQAIADAKSGAETTAANALATARTEISAEIDADVKVAKDRADEAYTLASGKVDSETYATDKKALQDEDKAIREIAEGVRDAFNTFMNNEEIDETVNTLKEIQAEIAKMTDATELELALASKADKTALEGVEGRVKAIEDAPYVTKSQLDEVDGKFGSYTNTEALTQLLAGKQDTIPAETYDEFGAAAAAEEAAKGHADSVAATAKSEAITAAAEAVAELYATKTALGELETALDGRLEALEAHDHSTYATKAELTAHGEAADAKYATKDELAPVKQTAENAAAKVETLEDKIDEITEVGGEPNVIDYIKVNGTILEVERDESGKSTKTVNVIVPTKASDLTDDTGFDARITAAQTKANEAAAAATAAQGTADSGVSKADAAQAKADANAEAIAALQGVDTTHGNEINALKGKVGDETAGLVHDVAALSATVGGHTTTLATLGEKDAAHDEALAGLNSTVGGHSTDIANLKTAVGNVYTKTEADGKFATGTALTEEVNRAKAAEKANADAIAALSSGILVDEIARVEGLVTTEKNRAEGVEANHEGRIAKMETFWAVVETPDETIDTLAEIVKYIESDESGAAAMTESIAKNASDITALTGRVKANEDKLAGIDTTVNKAIAAAINAAKPGNAGETAGLAVTNAVENGIEFADGKGTVHSLNVNKLVQTKNTYLVLNGGNAALTWPEDEVEE